MSFRIMPFLEDPRAGIATLGDLLERQRLSFEGISKVVSALGYSHCDEAVDLLVSIVSKDHMAKSLGDVWINAVAALDTSRSREILMSFIDPACPQILGSQELGREDVLVRRIAELAEVHPLIRARILNLCRAKLDRAKRPLLASIIVQFKNENALIEGMNLLDD